MLLKNKNTNKFTFVKDISLESVKESANKIGKSEPLKNRHFILECSREEFLKMLVELRDIVEEQLNSLSDLGMKGEPFSLVDIDLEVDVMNPVRLSTIFIRDLGWISLVENFKQKYR